MYGKKLWLQLATIKDRIVQAAVAAKALYAKLHAPQLNLIPTGCCHVTLIYGLIPPMAGRNRVKTPDYSS